MPNLIRTVLEGVCIFIEVLCWVILADSVLSWVLPMSRVREFTSRICDPIVNPFRKLTQKITRGRSRVDFSPTLAILTMFFITMLLSGVIAAL